MERTVLPLLLLGALAAATAFSTEESELDIIEKILQDYNPEVRARNGTNDSGATVVHVNFYVRNVDYIDDSKMEYAVQLTFRQQWNDDRLKFISPVSGRRYISLKNSNRIWIPDTFFTNEKSGHVHDLLTPNMYVRVYPNGEVVYSIRVSLVLSCPMIFKKFPFDHQYCSIRTASYGYTTEDIIFKWTKKDPVQMTSDLHLPHFSLERFDTDYCDSITNTGLYSCLQVNFNFRREFSYYLIQVFIPSTSLVIMTWLSFWLSSTEVVGRLLLTLVSYLINVVALVILNFTFPKASYTKAIDVWTGVCLTFVSLGVWELIVVHRLNRLGKAQDKKEEEKLTLSEKVDYYVRIIYPIAFVLFSGLYAAGYLCNHEN